MISNFFSSGCPPLASSETLFSSSMMNIDRGFKIMSWDQFSRLDPECKNSEIQRLLPLVSYLTEDINNVQRDVIAVENRLQEIKWEKNWIGLVVLNDIFVGTIMKIFTEDRIVLEKKIPVTEILFQTLQELRKCQFFQPLVRKCFQEIINSHFC